jgi:hypothetical protein
LEQFDYDSSASFFFLIIESVLEGLEQSLFITTTPGLCSKR